MERYAWEYARFFYGKCDAVISPSEAVTALLNRHSIGGVHTVPNGIDLDKFKSKHSYGSLRKELTKGNSKARVVLYLGRISREKRIETLIRAAKSMKLSNPNTVFVIAGTGPAAQHYKSMVSRMGLAVKFGCCGEWEEGYVILWVFLEAYAPYNVHILLPGRHLLGIPIAACKDIDLVAPLLQFLLECKDRCNYAIFSRQE